MEIGYTLIISFEIYSSSSWGMILGGIKVETVFIDSDLLLNWHLKEKIKVLLTLMYGAIRQMNIAIDFQLKKGA